MRRYQGFLLIVLTLAMMFFLASTPLPTATSEASAPTQAFRATATVQAVATRQARNRATVMAQEMNATATARAMHIAATATSQASNAAATEQVALPSAALPSGMQNGRTPASSDTGAFVVCFVLMLVVTFYIGYTFANQGDRR